MVLWTEILTNLHYLLHCNQGGDSGEVVVVKVHVYVTLFFFGIKSVFFFINSLNYSVFSLTAVTLKIHGKFV